MRLNSRQVADKLGYKSLQVIRELVKKGILRDYGVTKKGSQRHYGVFNSVEVSLLKQHQAGRNSFGQKDTNPEPQQNDMEDDSKSTIRIPSRLDNIEKRLKDIEYDLNALVNLLS